MDMFFTADGVIALVTLSAMEIVLGIDNVVFIAILTGRLPAARQRPWQRRCRGRGLVPTRSSTWSAGWRRSGAIAFRVGG